MLIRHIFIFLFAALILSQAKVSAQVTGPEQDCGSAIAVCQDIYVQNNSYSGFGNDDEINMGLSCTQGENNSVWYIFTVTAAGTLEFTIDPNFFLDDYDFALYDLTGFSCADIGTGVAPEVRCNWSATLGQTGLDPGFAQTSAGAGDPPFCAPLNVSVGETYVLMIDNFSSSSFGYTLDFSSSTAVIYDTLPPSLLSIDSLSCSATDSVTISITENVLCADIAANGSDFNVSGPSPVTVVGAIGTTCNGGSFTNEITVYFNSPINTPGLYTLNVQVGTDGNTFADNCGNEIGLESIDFNVPDVLIASFDLSISPSCGSDTVILQNTSSGTPSDIMWNFGDGDSSNLNSPTHVYVDTGMFTISLSISNADCASFTDTTISISNTFSANFFSPASTCIGDTVNFFEVPAGVGSSISWDFGDGTSSTSYSPSHVYTSLGTYDITMIVTEALCADTVARQINIIPGITANFSLSDSAICQGESISFQDLSDSNPVAWTWIFGDGDSAFVPAPVHTFDLAGIFDVSLTVADQSCGLDDTSMTVNVTADPVVNLGNDTMVCPEGIVGLNAFTPNASYNWSTGDFASTIEVEEFPASIWVEVSVNGCTAIDSILIDLQLANCEPFFIPNAFTPNNDGLNDYFAVHFPDHQSYEIRIFNRWGDMVYFNDELDEGWDGVYKDTPQDMETYTYQILVINLAGQKNIYSGNLTLIR